MMSKHLLNLECLWIAECKYETLKSIVKFQKLEYVVFDFITMRNELIFLWEKSRTLEKIEIHGKQKVQLERTTRRSKNYQIITFPKLGTGHS